jgi:GTP-binding protein
VKPAALAAKQAAMIAIAAKHPAAHPDVLVTSSSTGLGIDQLRGSIAALAD